MNISTGMPTHCQFLPGRPHYRLLDKPATRQWRRQCPNVCPSPASVHPTRPLHSPVHCQFLPGRSHRRLLDKPITRQWRRRVHGHPLASVHPQRLCISHSPCHSPIRAHPCPSVPVRAQRVPISLPTATPSTIRSPPSMPLLPLSTPCAVPRSRHYRLFPPIAPCPHQLFPPAVPAVVTTAVTPRELSGLLHTIRYIPNLSLVPLLPLPQCFTLCTFLFPSSSRAPGALWISLLFKNLFLC